jgi:hypothetical protein
MVDPLHEPDPTAGEAGDEAEVPQGTVAGQDLALQIGGQAQQAVVVAGRRQADLAHVAGDVEAGVVDPARPVDAERHPGEATPEPGHRAEPGDERVLQLAEAEAPSAVEQGASLERRHRPDVHGGAGALEPHEAGVERGEPIRAHADRR